MPSKRKKLSKKQRKEQRRAAMERVRRERGWEAPPPPPTAQEHELLGDMLPLFPEIADPSAPLPSIEPVMTTLVGSYELADEPEFEGIIVDPVLCTATFVQAAEELGHDPDSLLELSEEEREDAQLDILAETVRRLLTDDLRQQILDGLEQLRVRLKQAGDREGVARSAMLLSFLDQDVSSEMWIMVGLVQAIFQRSVYIGFEMAESSMLAMAAKEEDEDPASFVERLAASSVGRKTEALLKRVPGLRKYLAKQADVTWEEGRHAVFMGELYLGLYSTDELMVGLELFEQIAIKDFRDEEAEEIEKIVLSDDEMKEFLLRVDVYIAEVFTLERMAQLRVKLDQMLRERAFEEKWLNFVFMLTQYMDAPDAAENERHFLVSAFLGELKHGGEALEEEWMKSKEDE